jgi:putative integral membrane protein (TIGR02587 family)
VRDLGRAAAGALIFGLPMLMTMELWELGLYLDRWRILVLLALSFPMLMFLSHHVGFERTMGWQDDLRDTLVAYGIGVVVSGLVLTVLGVIDGETSFSDMTAKIVLQTVPTALGALLARSQLGENAEKDKEEPGYFAELGVMMVGALFLSLNIAPTEEMVLIAYGMTSWHSLALLLSSLVIMHGFVYASGFKGGTMRPSDKAWWDPVLRFTLVGYVLALIIAIYALWTFARLDGHGIEQVVRATIVLGFPAAIGAAAARLIL